MYFFPFGSVLVSFFSSFTKEKIQKMNRFSSLVLSLSFCRKLIPFRNKQRRYITHISNQCVILAHRMISTASPRAPATPHAMALFAATRRDIVPRMRRAEAIESSAPRSVSDACTIVSRCLWRSCRIETPSSYIFRFFYGVCNGTRKKKHKKRQLSFFFVKIFNPASRARGTTRTSSSSPSRPPRATRRSRPAARGSARWWPSARRGTRGSRRRGPLKIFFFKGRNVFFPL